MKTIEAVKKGTLKIPFKGVFIGGPGDGKTHLAATFPKCLFAITAPGEEDTFLNNPDLSKNIVGWEHFIPKDPEDTKRVMQEMDAFCVKAREMAEKGEIETFVIDNFSYYADYRWLYIKHHEKNLHLTRSGAFDTMNAFGSLRDDLMEFFLMKLLTIPCNVIANVHMMIETDDAMEKKADKSNPYSAAILGSFRDKIQGMVSYVFYLQKVEKKDKKGEYSYFVRTDRGGGKNAKSRLHLPPVIADVSYRKIADEIKKARSK